MGNASTGIAHVLFWREGPAQEPERRKRTGESMTKAIFLDYTGTIVEESSEEMKEAIQRIWKNSAFQTVEELMEAWGELLGQCEKDAWGPTYLTADELVDKTLGIFEEKFQLKDDLRQLHTLIQRSWVYAPVCPDVREFFDLCPLPIYVISNNGEKYVRKAMERNGLTPAGYVCADMVRAYKPRRELFEKALEISGCAPEEVVHIGDSYRSDVQGAAAAGIRPIFLQRKDGTAYEGVTAVRRLPDVLPLLK